jgi:hypothetical protein
MGIAGTAPFVISVSAFRSNTSVTLCACPWWHLLQPGVSFGAVGLRHVAHRVGGFQGVVLELEEEAGCATGVSAKIAGFASSIADIERSYLRLSAAFVMRQ